MIFPPRQAGGVIGWTGAMAAYGPFAVRTDARLRASTGSARPTPFFYWAAFFYLVCIAINWWFYARKGAEKPC